MSIANAQTKVVTGKIISEDDGLPIPGVTVLVPGTSVGTTTDFDGNYELPVDANVTILRFSFIGMETQDVEIGSRTIINVVMKLSMTSLDEVIVVAYGTTTKKTFTGSAAVIKSEEITQVSGGIVKAIQGTVAGVQVVGDEIRVRGTGSFTASGSPLYVVDGVVNAPQPNEEDIESLTVLKDAASTTLYGSRGANGVIIITLKKGKKSKKPTFEVKYQKSYFNPIKEDYDLMNAEQHFRTNWEGLRNRSLIGGNSLADANTTANDDIVGLYKHNPYNMDQPYDADGNLKTNAQLLYSSDWVDAILREAIRDEVYIGSTGGSDNLNYHFSLFYNNYQGLVDNNKTEDFSAELSLNSVVNENISMGIRTRIEYENGQNSVQNGGENNLYMVAKDLNPVTPIYMLVKNQNGDGTWTYDYNLDDLGNKQYEYTNSQYNGYSPLGLMEYDYDKSYKFNSYFSPFLKIKLIEGLDFYTYGSARLNTTRGDYWQTNLYGSGATVNGLSYKDSFHSRLLSGHAQLTYKFDLDAQHHFDILVATNREHYKTSDFDVTLLGFPLGEVSQEFTGGTVPQKPNSSTLQDSKIAYLSNVKYDYKHRYYLSASLRHDGSAKFGKDNRWGTFWSVGGSWRVSEENFMQNLDWVDDLKFRASYGVTGTDAIDSYMFGNYFNMGNNYDHMIGLVHSSLPNDDLGWESNYQFSTAIEFELFKTMSGVIEFYNKNTKDLLLSVPIPLTTGFQSVFRNIGEMNNKGIELTLNNINIKTNEFTWKSMFTMSYNKNEITKLPEGKPIDDGSKRRAEGESYHSFYMREWAGVNPANGAAQWDMDILDADGNVTGKEITEDYTSATKYFVGNAVADVFGSIKNDFTYKGFGLSVNFYYSIGGKIYDGAYASVMHDGADGVGQLSTDALNAWQEPGDITDVPIYINNNTTSSELMSTRWLVDGTFLKLKNLSFSYNLSDNICKKLKVSSMKFFVTADNLFTLSKFKSGDPEQRLSGRSFGYLFPNVRTIRVGLHLKI